MKFDKTNIKGLIQEVADKWSYSGFFTLYGQGEKQFGGFYGYENRDIGNITNENTRYLLDAHDMFFAKLSLLMEVSGNNIKLSDKIAKYIPELKHGEKITIRNLLKNESGLFDYYHSHLMVQFENNDELKGLPEYDRVRKEHTIRYENRNFDTVLGIINGEELKFEPGKDARFSSTDSVIINEVLKRVTDLNTFDYLKKNVFDVLGMDTVQYGTITESLSFVAHNMTEHVSVPVDFDIEGVFSVNNKDLEKLMVALLKKRFLSETVWKTALKKNRNGNCIMYETAGGYHNVSTDFLGYGVTYYFDFNNAIAYSCVSNEQQLYKFADNNWSYYRKEFRNIVTSIMTYPENTRMVKLTRKNFWNTLDISVRPEQNQFVLDAKASVALGLFYKTQQIFVQMEGDIVVGLLVLDIDKKKGNYHISIVIIDKKFQNKGYGKLMIKWAVEKLKEEGATSLTIGVNRKNIAAKKVYMSAGFKPKSVYGGGMELELKI